jgi:tetratricopeptide (TPR) repeat protein
VEPETPRSRRTLTLSLLLVALTFIAYVPALRGGFIWDDDDYVTNNPNLHSLRGLMDIWATPRTSPQYYPLTFTTFWVEQQLWGMRPLGYHVDNVLLHAIAALLFWRLLVSLEVPGAFLAAMIFALHPVHVESAAWISERKNVLSAMFYFGAAAAWFRAWPEPPPINSRSYWMAVVFFVCALFSKTVTCTLPVALLLVIWWKKGRLTRYDVFPMIPMFLLGIAAAVSTAYLEVSHVAAVGPEWDWPILDRILIAGRVIWFYAMKLVLPFNLSFIYPKWRIDSGIAWQWAFPLAAVLAVVVLWIKRSQWGRGPFVAATIFILTLTPALGFFAVYPMRYSYVADHFQYHASAALITLIAVGLYRLLRALPEPARIGAVAVPLLVLTLMRAAVFRDSEVLWRDTHAKNPNSWMVHLNLARILAERGKDDEAQNHFELQLAFEPNLPETHWNMGVNLMHRGQLDAAMQEYDRALARDSRFPQAYFGRGNVYLEKGDLDAAAHEYKRAIELKPDYAEACFNLGLVLERQGDPYGAMGQYRRAIAQRPNYAKALNQLGQLLAKTKQYPLAIEHYLRAIDADPQFAEAHLNLAGVLMAVGQKDQARDRFNQAVRLDPSLERFAPQILGTPR